MPSSQPKPGVDASAATTEEFRRALAEGQVVLHYQPQVELRTNVVRGAEALIRWRHPTGGLLPPDDFLPGLAESDLMPTITAWVLRTACRAAVGWETGSVAVNVAASDAARAELVDSVRAALAETGLAAQRLTLEVTEHALVRDMARASEHLRSLADDGVRVSLDDFGTGHSSLLYLRELPITEIKIDNVFTAGVGNDDDDAIIAGLVRLAHTVGVPVVAEGVETAAQAGTLTDLGCDVGQGWLFGKPAEMFAPDALVAVTHRRSKHFLTYNRNAPIAGVEAQNFIRRLLDEGASLHTIAAALNRHGVPTRHGTRWTGTTVGRAISELDETG